MKNAGIETGFISDETGVITGDDFDFIKGIESVSLISPDPIQI